MLLLQLEQLLLKRQQNTNAVGEARVLGTVGENVELAQQLYNSMEGLKN